MKTVTAGTKINLSPFWTSKRSLTLLAGVLLLGLGNPALAAPSYCSAPSGNTDGLAVSDMTFNSNNADDCYGVVSVVPGGNASAETVWPATGTWSLLAKVENATDSGSGDVLGVTFELDPIDITSNNGKWVLSWSETGDPGFDLTMDLVGAIKTQTGFASYLFESLVFTADPLSGEGTWAVKFRLQGQSEEFPDISNLSLWYQNAAHTPPNGDDDEPPQDEPPQQVPEPATLGLLGLGLLAIGMLRRRKFSVTR